MKRIVILCDGTWNRSDDAHPTNVVRVAQALAPMGDRNIPQVPVYVPGVGAGHRGVTMLGQTLDRAFGGLLGLGLVQNVVDAYRHLVFLYEPGDEVYIFGFSRGAYTARRLVGLIRSTGILARGDLHLLPMAMGRYRTTGDPRLHPRHELSQQWRARNAPRVMTSERDRPAFEAEGRGDAPLLQVTYLGVWDTVGTMGLPPSLNPLSLFGFDRFHGTDLSSMVAAARHAVALDEMRRDFEPTGWTNLGELNAKRAAQTPPLPPSYFEMHFAGDHGGVGGGGPIKALSAIALRWILAGAEECGLRFDPEQIAALEAESDPYGPIFNSPTPKGGLVSAIMRRLGRPRPGPRALDEIHESVKSRWTFEAKDSFTGGGYWPYRPGSLRKFERDLQALRGADRDGS